MDKFAELEYFSCGAHDIAPQPFTPSGYNLRFLINQNSIQKSNQDLSNLDEIEKK